MFIQKLKVRYQRKDWRDKTLLRPKIIKTKDFEIPRSETTTKNTTFYV